MIGLTDLKTPRHLFNASLVVQRRSTQSSNGRTPSQGWSSIGTIRAHVQPMKSSRATNLYGSERAKRMYTVFCAPGDNVKDEDRFVYQDPRTKESRFLKIVSDPSDLISEGVLLEIDCESVRGRDG